MNSTPITARCSVLGQRNDLQVLIEYAVNLMTTSLTGEKEVRQALFDKGYIDCIVQLQEKLFYNRNPVLPLFPF